MKRTPAKYLPVTLVVLFPIVFTDRFERLVDSVIVEPFFTNFQPTYLIDLIFWLAIIALCAVLIVYKTSGRYLERSGILYLSVVSLYLILSKFKWLGFDHWDFITLKATHRVAYLDSLIILPLVLILYKLIPNRASEQRNEDNTFRLLDDSHISDEAMDELNRKQLAEYLASFIYHSQSDVSTAIAINAKWGDGKTSFQRMVSQSIAKKDSTAIRIEFNPWRSSGSNKIIQDFFELYSASIKKFNVGLGDRLLSYGRKLLAGSDWWNGLPIVGSTDNDNNARYAEINDAITAIGRKIVVFVDDLDRLSFTEILEVVKLIRNSANFGNTFFVVGYDEEYMHEALRAHNEYGKENFLEKIFQVQFDLSQVDPGVIKRKLAQYLKEALPQSQSSIQAVVYPETTEAEMISTDFLGRAIPDQFIPKLLTNLRDVKRFVNYFSLCIQLVYSEVVFRDFFYISLLKFRFPLLIRSFLRNESKFLAKKFSDNYQHYEVKEKEISKAAKALQIKDYDIATIVAVLKTLYSVPQDTPERRSILFPENFFLYYDNALNTRGVLYGEVVPLLDKGWSDIQAQIIDWVKAGKSGFLTSILRDIDPLSSRPRFEKVTKIWVLLTNLNHDPDRNVSHWLTQVSKNRENLSAVFGNDLREFCYSLFEVRNGSVFFYDTYICRLILRRYIDKEDFYFPLTQQEVQELTIKRLRHYISISQGFDIRVFNAFYYNCWDYKTDEGAVRILKGANEIVMQYVKNYPEDFLRFTIRSKRSPHLDNDYTFEPFTPQYFGTWDEFEMFLRRQAAQNIEFRSMSAFFELFKKSNYQVFYAEETLPWIEADIQGNSSHKFFKEQTYVAFLESMFQRFNSNSNPEM